RRVAVARALAFEPPVMLMDEPLGALDKKLREAMQFEIKRIQRQVGATVLYVTHDQEEALTMSDRVAIMQGGNIVQIGAPSSLYHAPATRFVADFVGKMSFVDGEVVSFEDNGMLVRLAADVIVRTASVDAERGALRLGDEVILAMRPERIALKKRGPQGLGAIPAQIESLAFVGSFHAFIVRLDLPGSPLVEVQVVTGSGVDFRAGDLVDLVPDPHAVSFFSKGEGSVA
ncbi:ABC transporter ATP-binding protein, partial [Agrobacterium pusense]|uniref:ABC transporter ATP-binding protein n=1 Tax=Agrobacterium pusense TaxID=648995 RepID=UPI0011605CEE